MRTAAAAGQLLLVDPRTAAPGSLQMAISIRRIDALDGSYGADEPASDRAGAGPVNR